MESNNDSENVTAADLIADDQFLQWVRCPTATLDTHWKTRLAENPDLAKTAEEAKVLIDHMRFETHAAPADRKKHLLEAIRREAGMVKDIPTHRSTIRLRFPLAIAASIVLFAVASVWIYSQFFRSDEPLAHADTSNTHAVEGRVFLRDGRSIPLAEWAGAVLTAQTYLIEQGTHSASIDSIVSPTGYLVQLDLPDGTRVHLNSGTMLRVPESSDASHRRVGISGRGYFEVAADQERPFIVAFDTREITVLGTAFDVLNYPGSLQTVTLAEGSLRIDGKGMEALTLTPGQQARFDDSIGIPIITTVDVNQYTAWRTGVFSFQGDPIEQVMNQLAVWYGVKVEYEGERPVEPIHGTIPTDLALTDVLVILENADIDASLVLDGNVIRVAKR